MIVSGINGDFVDFKSPKQIADAIVDYYEDKYLNNYTVEPDFFNSFKVKYSWQSIIEQYHELTESLKIKN